VHSTLGMAWKAVRDNEARARLLGYNAERLKFMAYVLSGTLAGIAGGLYALINSYTTVEFLHWALSGDPVMWTIVGGAGTLVGPVLGTVVLVFLRDFLSTVLIHIYPFLVGAILIVSITFCPKGIVGSVRGWQRSRRPAPAPTLTAPPALPADSRGPVPDPGSTILETHGLTQVFGGLVALDGVDFTVR